MWIGVVGNNVLGSVKLPDRLRAEYYLLFLENTLADLLYEVVIN